MLQVMHENEYSIKRWFEIRIFWNKKDLHSINSRVFSIVPQKHVENVGFGRRAEQGLVQDSTDQHTVADDHVRILKWKVLKMESEFYAYKLYLKNRVTLTQNSSLLV